MLDTAVDILLDIKLDSIDSAVDSVNSFVDTVLDIELDSIDTWFYCLKSAILREIAVNPVLSAYSLASVSRWELK